MTRRNLARWFAGCWLALAGAASARAQMGDAWCEPLCEHDMQLFAPVDFDFDCLPIRDECGFFFNYNKLSWAINGERTTIGQPGLMVLAENVVPAGPFDQIPNANFPPQRYTIINGIQDTAPDADFGWGDRYELGYYRGGNGWLVGILDGPKVVTNKVYGFNQLEIPNTLPVQNGFPGPGFGNPNFDVENLTVDNATPDPFPNAVLSGSADIPTSLNGFGSVHVNFATPPGYLFGFRDYWITPDPDTNEPAPVVGGPSYRILTITRDQGLVTDITIVRHADGIIDDLDGDGIAGFGVILADLDGDGTIDDDEVLASFIDYGDAYEFNVRFDRLYVHNSTETQGIEVMRTHELDNSHLPVKEQRNYFSIGYGARFFRLRDNFLWDGRGDVFGRSFTHTSAENQIVGPQIRAKWTHQRGRFGFDLDGRFVAGYNIQDLGQEGGIGENLNPGGLNSPFFAQPTYFNYGRQENFFTPLAEMRVEGSYQVTSAIALKLGYTAIFADNITRASQVVQYSLPDMGFREDQIGKQEIFINGADFGVEVVY